MERKNINISKVLEVCNGKLIIGNKDIDINGFSKDTRTINSNDIYIAIKGERVDGNDFIEQAFTKGAIGCITDKNISNQVIEKYKNTGKVIIKVTNTIEAIQKLAKYKRSLYNIPVIAVTGSVGKTSTKDIIANVLAQKYKVLKTKGNMNNHIGLPLTLLNLQEHTAVVVEMGMNHLGEISLLTNIAKPTGCVITNIGTSHIGNLGSRENILKAKLEILEGLEDNGFILINNDNDLLNKWAINNNKYKIYTYGIENKSDYMATSINETQDNSIFNICKTKIKVPVGGRHFIYNGICAFAIGDILGIQRKKIAEGISNFKLTSKRMEIETIKNGIKVINDSYNASYDSMKAALEVLKKTDSKRKIAVLGDMLELGDYSKELHEKVGEEVVKNKIDILITIGEYAKNIAFEAKKNKMKNIYMYDNIEEGIKFIKDIVTDGDLILLKASNSMNFSRILDELKREDG